MPAEILERLPEDSILETVDEFVRYPDVELERVLGLTVTSSAAVAVDPLTATVAYPAGCVVILYNSKTNRQTHIVSPSKKTITSLAFSWDGKFLATGECGHQPQLRIWDVERRQQLAEFPGHKYGINCVAFSPNLKYVVSVGSQHDSVVNVWDWRSDTKVASNKVSSKVKSVTFAASGNYFVTVGNRHVKFWYLEHAKLIANMAEPMPLMGRSAILGDQRNNNFCDADCGKGALHENTYAITKSGLLCVFNSRRLLDKWVELKTSVANSISVGEDRIFVGCSDGTVRCFDPLSLHFVCTLPKPHHLGVDIAKGVSPNAVMYHPENSRYPDVVALTYDEVHKRVTCVYNDHSLYVWSVVEPKRVGKCFSFLFHAACIWGIETYSSALQGLPKGTFLTCSSDDTIRAWNLHDSSVKRNIFCPELLKIIYMDSRLSYITDIDLTTQNSATGGSSEKVDANYDGKNGVRCMKISHDGSHLACGDRSGNITIFGVPQMEQLGKIEAHDSEVLCLEYTSPAACGFRHLLASGSRDRFIHIFDVARSYQFIKTLADHSSSITALKFVRSPLQGSLSSSGQNNVQMISCGADKQIIFRRAQLPAESSSSADIHFNREHLVSGKCTLFDMELDGAEKHILTACQDRHVRVYSVTSSKNTRTFRGAQGEDGTLIKVVLDPSGTFCATSCTDKSIYVYDYQTAECLAQMFGHSELVTGLRFSDDGRNLISVSGDGCIFVWKLPAEITTTIRSKMGLVNEQDNTIIWGSQAPSQQGTLDSKLDVNGNRGLGVQSAPQTPTDDGKLPNWAKKRVGGGDLSELGVAASSGVSDSIGLGGSLAPPRGKWAQSMESMEQGGPLVIKSVLASDPIVHLPRLNKSKSEGAVNVVVNEDDEKDEPSSQEANIHSSNSSGSGLLNNNNSNNVSNAAANNKTNTSATATDANISSNSTKQMGLRSHSPPNALLGRMRLAHQQTDSSGASSMKTTGDEDADCERSDTDQSEKVFYPPAGQSGPPSGGGSSFSVKMGLQNSLSQPSSGGSSGFVDLIEARRRLRSRGGPKDLQQELANSDLNSDSDRDSATPSKFTDRGSLFMSTENLERLGQREKFMKSNYETLGRTAETEQDIVPSLLRKSITAKFKTSPDEIEKKAGPLESTPIAKTGPTIFEKGSLISGAANTPLKPQTGKKPIMSPWASGNHREELSKALQEAKQRLQGVGKGHKLSTSKSIGDLLSLKDRKDFGSDTDKTDKDSRKEELIRRSTSMSDLGGAARLFTTVRKKPAVNDGTEDDGSLFSGGCFLFRSSNNNRSMIRLESSESCTDIRALRDRLRSAKMQLSSQQQQQQSQHQSSNSFGQQHSSLTSGLGSLSASGGIWAQAQKRQFPSYATTPRKYGGSMSRSASMGSLNNPGMYAAPAVSGGQNDQLVGANGLGPGGPLGGIHRAPSAHSLRRGNTNLTKVRSSSALNRNSLINKHLVSPESDSDSDSESTTLSDAVTHRHSLSRSFSRQSQVGLVTPHSGQQLNPQQHQQQSQRGQFTLPRRYSSNANHGEGPRALVEPMPQALSQVAVGHQPLSQELCDRVAEDLKRVTRQAIQLFHRVTLNMELPLSAKSTMTQTLASSVLQAQQHLSLAAPPPPMNPMTHAMLAQQQAMIGHQNHAHSTAQHSQPPLPQQQTPNVTLDASALSMLLGGAAASGANAGADPSAGNHSINSVLQQYTQHILKMVEEKISQAKPDPGAK
ncbi:WD repeat-containing protein 62-like isoform X4 [Varroa destructor]|uniref:MABP1/WDR62 second WD40 domain-containing protein n=1 Tax=Varroa destructor TaxID=109461 RepID=A0A7M7KXS6_VARDE|nr:WD repeat-containing protein 62-like isoform X4 [Varroa destructor]XP_022672160.1 WD repeat-containing protein 62-like isoform X4 [Varroa destructor]XP_022672169.1 WD repeat-containing protein 62-like isoform X4 [Varroa destructor]